MLGPTGAAMLALLGACGTGIVHGDARGKEEGIDAGHTGADARPAPPPSDPGCGARVPGYTYVRAHDDDAPWNVPACALSRWDEGETYVDRYWWFGNNRNGEPAEEDPFRGRMNFGLEAATDFAIPIYDAADATTTRRIMHRAEWPGSINIAGDETVPWNPAWVASRGSDATLIILNHDTGQEWDFWGLVQKDLNGFYDDRQCWLSLGYSKDTHLCTGSAQVVRHTDGTDADYRSYGGNFPSRGVRIQLLAMLTRPGEVAAGEIRHALMMALPNTMFGPWCTEDELGTAAEGTTCGVALAPAGGGEHTSCVNCTNAALTTDQHRARSVPEGIRFAHNASDEEIEAWLDDRAYTGRKRETARIFAVALRDYGWFITDTGGVSSIDVSGGSNPATAAAWAELGIETDGKFGKDLLYGLMRRENLYAVEPATNECADGTKSHYGCRADRTHY